MADYDAQFKELKETVKRTAQDEVNLAIVEVKNLLNDAQKNNVSISTYETKITEIQKNLDGINLTGLTEDVNKLHVLHGDLAKTLQAQGNAINSINVSVSKENAKKFDELSQTEQFHVLTKAVSESDVYKSFLKRNLKGATEAISITDCLQDEQNPEVNKAITGITADHTGTIMITDIDSYIRDIPRQNEFIQNIITDRPTNEVKITFGQITDYTDVYNLGAQMLTENEEITDVNFKTAEITSDVVRMGVSMPISQRYFRGKPSDFAYHVLNILPDALNFKKERQILFADGNGSNLDGIITNARKFDLTPNTYVATNFSSVASHNAGTQSLITFAVAHGISNGDKLTIANSTAYNDTFEDVILVDEFTVIINFAYVVEADTSAWTGSSADYWYHEVDGAQELDVLAAATSILDAGLYQADTLFINPKTLMRSKTLKDTTGQYVNYEEVARLLGLNRVVAMSSIPAGWFLIGDFSPKSVELRTYKPLSIQFIPDLTMYKKNAVCLVADTEFHLVKHNPQWYIYDTFANAKDELETS